MIVLVVMGREITVITILIVIIERAIMLPIKDSRLSI